MRESAYNAKTKKVAIALAAIALVLSASLFVPVKQAEATHQPTHTDIQNTINLAKGYVDSLYKDRSPSEVGSSTHAVLAEYPAMPIKIVANDRTIRPGEDVNIKLDTKTSYLSDLIEVSGDTVEYRIRFRALDSFNVLYDKVPLLKVRIDYDYGVGRNIRVEITNLQWDSGSSRTYADIYLGSDYIARASSGNVGTTWVWTSVSSQTNDSFLRSFRYIERHGTHLGREFYNAIGDTARGTELANRLIAEGYTLGKDIYSPMFYSGTTLADNFLYESGSNGVYRDCYTEPAMRDSSYQYHSKVCTIGVGTYIGISRSNDWLVPTLWAIHILNKYNDADRRVYDGAQTWSPRDVARFVETKWIPDIGIKSPSSDSYATAVRTAAFLTLETKLGFGYGDTTSQTYANKAAKALINPQVKSTTVTRENEDGTSTSFIRPIHKGGIYTAWNGFNYVAKKSVLQQVADWFNQPDETLDIKPSNTESTISVAQALRVYDCYVYGFNCTNVP
jgi:hypothetical protein